MKIVIAASEVVPFVKTGGLADVTGALSLALEELNQEVIVIMPKYKAIDSKKHSLKRIKKGFFEASLGKRVKVYFVENEAYFNRDGLYTGNAGDHKDNLERFSFYSRECLSLLKEINFRPDIIHVHDWQASLIPVYLKTIYAKDEFYSGIKTLLTIHNIGYQGVFAKDEFPKLGLDWSIFGIDGLEFYGSINILKGGIVFSDMINTVSPTYSRQIQTEEFGFGLEGALNKRSDSISGILNGLDYSIWDPAVDKFIVKNYSAKNIDDKAVNKQKLQEICNFQEDKDCFLIGIVSRLAEQKGFDILVDAADTIFSMGLEMVILGVGDLKYHEALKNLSIKYPKVLSLHLNFDDALAHKIYAGSDMFLMPSKYEPCGLGQMISLKYGTIPLVFKTGGLADTVDKNNGFTFEKYTSAELIAAIRRSLKVFKDKKRWRDLVSHAMKSNFSWKESAREYIRLYEKTKAR